MIRNQISMLAIIFLFLLPALMWLGSGEPFPQAPATEKLDSRFAAVAPFANTALPAGESWRERPITVTTHAGTVELPGPCHGVPECEGMAQTALPGAVWQTYLTLEALRRDFEDACRDWTVGADLRRSVIRAKARGYAAPYVTTVCPTTDADYHRAFCGAWSC
jgi:hypothetical protein